MAGVQYRRGLPLLSGLLCLVGGLSAIAQDPVEAGPTALLHASFLVGCCLLVLLYWIAQRGGRPLLRFLALATLLPALIGMVWLLLEPLLSPGEPPVDAALPIGPRAHQLQLLASSCYLLAGLVLFGHWCMTRARDGRSWIRRPPHP